MIKQTAKQKKREMILDRDWIEDLVFVHHNIHSCVEIDAILELGEMSIDWLQCPMCGVDIKENGTINHRMQ